MKKLFFIAIILMTLNAMLIGQEKLKPNLRPFSEFEPDTIAYLKTNWGSGGFNYYTGYPLKRFLADVGLDIVSIRVHILPNSELIHMLSFSFQTEEEFKKEFKLPLTVQLDPVIRPEDGEIFQKLQKGRDGGIHIEPFTDEMRKLVENLTVGLAYY